jgi:hypothetical protein
VIWYEVRLRPEVSLGAFYDSFTEQDAEAIVSRHHFWDEPWWENAYVVRFQVSETLALEDRPDVDHVVTWDAGPDEEQYGGAWKAVSMFFHTSSSIACVGSGNAKDDEWLRRRMVHCFLNAQGMSQLDEARFHARALWGRLTIGIRWNLYLRHQWKRQQAALDA